MWKMVLIPDSKVAKVLDINEKIFSYKYLMWKMVLIQDSKVAKVLDINEKIMNLRPSIPGHVLRGVSEVFRKNKKGVCYHPRW
jgi:hypothetical protein